MRHVFLLVVFLCGFCVAGFASTDDLFRQSDERFSSAAAQLEKARHNYFSSLSLKNVLSKLEGKEEKDA